MMLLMKLGDGPVLTNTMEPGLLPASPIKPKFMWRPFVPDDNTALLHGNVAQVFGPQNKPPPSNQ